MAEEGEGPRRAYGGEARARSRVLRILLLAASVPVLMAPKGCYFGGDVVPLGHDFGGSGSDIPSDELAGMPSCDDNDCGALGSGATSSGGGAGVGTAVSASGSSSTSGANSANGGSFVSVVHGH